MRYEPNIDWSVDYELTDFGRRRLQKYKERGIPEGRTRLYESVSASFLEGLDRGESAKELRESLMFATAHLSTKEENFRLIDTVFHNILVGGLIARVETVTELPSAFKADFGQYE